MGGVVTTGAPPAVDKGTSWSHGFGGFELAVFELQLTDMVLPNAKSIQPLLPFYRSCGTREDHWEIRRNGRLLTCKLLCGGLNVDGDKERVLLCFSNTSDPEEHDRCRAVLHINGSRFFGVPLEMLDISRYVAAASNAFYVEGFCNPDNFGVAVHVVEKVPKDELLRSVAESRNSIHDVTATKELAHRLIMNGNCEDVIVDTLMVSLNCPLKKTRLQVPCRGEGCQHVQCFDALAYLEVNETTLHPLWRCPVCDRNVRVQELRIDLFTLGLLDALPLGYNLVEISPEGEWIAVDPASNTSVIDLTTSFGAET